jgi:hypothetical protein
MAKTLCLKPPGMTLTAKTDSGKPDFCFAFASGSPPRYVLQKSFQTWNQQAASRLKPVSVYAISLYLRDNLRFNAHRDDQSSTPRRF